MISRRPLLTSLDATLFAAPAGCAESERRWDPETARAELAREVAADVRATAAHTGHHELSAAVRAAIGKVPRHRFVPKELEALAYQNRPLPIGHNQTISQPLIVALMTELAAPRPADRVLEIGTGSGYQAAVLAEIVARVYTIEIVRPLGERAAALLRELGYDNIETRIGDGYAGWPEAAPFDAIVVTAAPDHVPQPLVDQLKPGGRLVIPVGANSFNQQLVVMTKSADGTLQRREALPVRFVPLTRER